MDYLVTGTLIGINANLSPFLNPGVGVLSSSFVEVRFHLRDRRTSVTYVPPTDLDILGSYFRERQDVDKIPFHPICQPIILFT